MNHKNTVQLSEEIFAAITGAEASETEIASAGGETATTRTRDRMAWAKKLYNNKLFIKQ